MQQLPRSNSLQAQTIPQATNIDVTNQPAPQRLNNGFSNIINTISNQVNKILEEIANQIRSFNEDNLEKQAISQDHTNENKVLNEKSNQSIYQDNQITQQQNELNQKIQQNNNDQKQQKIKQIRKKQEQLLEQLKALKLQQQLLANQLINEQQNNNIKQNEIQIETKNEQIQNQKDQYDFLQQIKINKTLSPVLPRQRYRRQPKKKLVIPQPIVPQMSRQQFQLKIKQIATLIRSKVQKQNPFIISKSRSVDKKQKLKKQPILDLPYILPKSTNINKLNTQIQNQQIKQNNKANPQSPQKSKPKSKSYIIAKQLVEQLIKNVFKKIKFKQKYSIKLDPIHHKYPITIFRKKIIEEKYSKQKQRYFSESLRQSMLNQRKQIFEKSRNK